MWTPTSITLWWDPVPKDCGSCDNLVLGLIFQYNIHQKQNQFLCENRRWRCFWRERLRYQAVCSPAPHPPLQPWCVFAFRKHTIVPKLTFTEMALIWSSNENLNQCSEANNNFGPKIIHRWEFSPVPPEVNIDKLCIDDFESENRVFWLHFL